MIKLTDYPSKPGALAEFRDTLLDLLGDEIILVESWEELASASMARIDEVSSHVTASLDSLEPLCRYILDHFNYDVDSGTDLFLDDEREVITLEGYPNVRGYIVLILGLDHLPRNFYEVIKKDTYADLLAISSLVGEYENESIIVKIKSEDRQASGPTERKVWTFYQRALNEQQRILRHYLYELRGTAISEATTRTFGFGALFGRHDYFIRRHPYDFSRENDNRRFDYRKLDRVSHRIDELSVAKAAKLAPIYDQDKALFYKQYFSTISAEGIFEEMQWRLSQLPVSSERIEILSSLEKHFNQKDWIAFFAIALPQVEGLFTEMTELSKEGNLRSLPIKVNRLRQYYELSDNYFDYYEFIVPSLRNQFMHSGLAQEYELHSYDLLTDLAHIITVFYELQNPMVKLKQVIETRSVNSFKSYHVVSEYFELLASVPVDQRREHNDAIVKFEQYLVAKIEHSEICQEVIARIPAQLEEFRDAVNRFDSSDELFTQLITSNQKELDNLITINPVRGKIDQTFNLYHNILDEIDSLHIFISNYRANLPSLPQEHQQSLDKTRKEYGRSLYNLHYARKNLRLIL